MPVGTNEQQNSLWVQKDRKRATRASRMDWLS